MKKIITILSFLTFGVFGSGALLAQSNEELSMDVNATVKMLKSERASIRTYFDHAEGYAVFPHVAKGGAGIGAAHGRGQLFDHDQLAGQASLTQITFGAQLGGQVYSEVIFFLSKPALESFKSGNVEFSAQAGAVAAAEGVFVNARYERDIRIFTVPRNGLMFEASIGGQQFHFTPYP